GLEGALFKFSARTGALLTLDVSYMYHGVLASTFFKNHLMFVKGGEIIWIDPDSQQIFKSQAIDNMTANRAGHFSTHDLAGFSETIYRLERQKVFLSGSTYQTESWDNYNYNTSSTLPEVYF